VSVPQPARWHLALAARSSRAHGRRTLVGLLDAAVAEFTAYGYHGARMNRIARRAGAAHGTLYVYFKDKADLLAAVHQDANAELEPVLLSMPVLEPTEAGLQAVRAWVRAVCEVFQRHGAVLQALADSMNDEDESEAGRAALASLARTSAHIADRIRASGSSGLDPNIAALCVWALIEGANRSVFRGELLVGTDDLVTGLSEFVHRSVFGAPDLS
jgi:AcrR family transcriptional regulator